MKNVLITGKNSYIGKALENWLMKEPDKYKVETIDLKDNSWKNKDFSKYQVVFHVAAIVHKKEKVELKELYFKVNKELPIEVAKKAKKANVSQFIFMSTMAIYGEEGKIGQETVIRRDTKPNPNTFYGISKMEAEIEIKKMNDDKFKVLILRPPMVYGPNCPGNYARLEKVAINSPIFPMIENKRSMLHIDKLCQTIKGFIDEENQGLHFPQDDDYVNTSLMVKNIARKNGKTIYLSKFAGFIIILMGKKINLINKVFGNLIYEK